MIFPGLLLNPALVQKHGCSSIVAKVIKSEKLLIEEKTDSMFRYELAIMGLLKGHPNVVDFIGYTMAPNRIIVMRAYSISLKDLLSTSTYDCNNLILVMQIAKDIANGMRNIHRCGVLHLDLKPGKFIFSLGVLN